METDWSAVNWALVVAYAVGLALCWVIYRRIGTPPQLIWMPPGIYSDAQLDKQSERIGGTIGNRG
jgi:hypothetical protein